MKREEQTNWLDRLRGILPLRVCLAYLFVSTLLLTGVSMARFVSQSYGDDQGKVAAISLEAEPLYGVDDSEIIYGENGVNAFSYPFIITSDSTEVALSYDIIVKFDTPLPVGMDLALDGDRPDEENGNRTWFSFSKVGEIEAHEGLKNEVYLLEMIVDPAMMVDEMADLGVEVSLLATQID